VQLCDAFHNSCKLMQRAHSTAQGLIKEYGIVEQHESDDEEKAGPAEGTVYSQAPPGQSAPTTAEEREAAAAAAAHLAAATPEVWQPASLSSC
jgi:hypothetical protein